MVMKSALRSIASIKMSRWVTTALGRRHVPMRSVSARALPKCETSKPELRVLQAMVVLTISNLQQKMGWKVLVRARLWSVSRTNRAVNVLMTVQSLIQRCVNKLERSGQEESELSHFPLKNHTAPQYRTVKQSNSSG